MRRLAGIIVLLLTASLLGAPSPAQAVTSNTSSSSTPNSLTTPPGQERTFSGTVRDTAGQPIEGACVDVQGSLTAYFAHACTDAAGHYEIGDVSTVPASYRLHASAVGHAARWWPNGAQISGAQVVALPVAGQARTVDFVLPSTAEASGKITGTVRRQDGTPASGAIVRAFLDTTVPAVQIAYTVTDGSYTLDGLVAGQYRIQVSGAGYPVQYVPGQPDLASAAPQTVTTAAATTVNETFLALATIPPATMGSLSGTVHDPAGTPVAGATVALWGSLAYESAALMQTVTDQNGHYALTGLAQASQTYYVRTSAPGYATAWSAGNVTPVTNSLPPVDTIRDVTVRPGVGAITGTLRDFDGGVPPRTSLVFTSLDGSLTFNTVSWFNGHFELPNVPAGQYRLTLEPYTRPYQYWPGGRTPQEYGTFTVADHTSTDLRETLLSPARIEATVLDDVTGQPITTACVLTGTSGWTACAPAIAPGVYAHDDFTQALNFPSVSATDGPYHFIASSGPAAATIGQTAKVTIRMKPGAQLAFDYTVPSGAQGPTQICYSATTSAPFQYDNGDRSAACPTVSGGHALLGPIRPGSHVNVFLQAPTGASDLGAQWVTGSGGGGDQREATDFTFVAGQTTNGPSQHLLYSGSIQGTVTGPGATSQVCPGPVYTGYLNCGAGAYTQPKLGPYRWPVSLALYGGGQVAGWSGAGTNRFNAGYVQVTSGGSAQADIRLRSLSPIGVTVAGVPTNTWTLVAFDPVTGDRVSDIGTNRGTYDSIWVPGQVVLKLSAPAMAQPCYVSIPQPALPGRRSQPSYVINPVAQLTITPGVNCRSDITPSLQPGSATRR